MYSDIPTPESVNANHDHVVRPILNRERSASNQKHRYVVQAWSNVDGWQDTRYRADWFDDAQFLANWLTNQVHRWLDETRLTRVRDTQAI